MIPRQLQLKAVSDLLEVAESLSSEQERNISIKACLQFLDELKLEKSDQAEINYLQGCAWYLSEDSEQRDNNVLKYLSAALELDFEHVKAKIYLCHYLFDSENYAEFLKHYQQIETQHLQGWRKLKFLELNLIAKLRISSVTEAESNHFISNYENAQDTHRPKIQELFDFSFSEDQVLSENLQQFIFKWKNYWRLENADQD